MAGDGLATDVPGRYIVNFPDEEAGFYNVLQTDYETFSTVYSCVQVTLLLCHLLIATDVITPTTPCNHSGIIIDCE